MMDPPDYSDDFDAIVIGAGAGRLFAASRLARLGYRTLVCERLSKIGGRASTAELDGFFVNNRATGRCKSLADVVTRSGGDVWLDTQVGGIQVSDGAVTVSP